MKIILAPFGSSGDVNPFVGVGVRLRERGHRVTVIANEHFAGLIEAEGLDFVASGTEQEYRELIDHPDIWHPHKSVGVLYAGILRAAPQIYERIADHYEPGSTVLAAPSFNIGARVAHDGLGIPLASLIPNPLLMRSIHSPARSPLLHVPGWTGSWGVQLAYKMMDRKYDRMLGEPLNELRRSLDLPPVHGIASWMRSPQQIICLWPDWLYERQPDWPEHAETTSFVHYDGVSTVAGDGDGSRGDPDRGEADRGDPDRGAPDQETPDRGSVDQGAADRNAADRDAPVVFTAGTAMSQGQELFAAAAEACAILKRRGLLLTQRPEQLPASLPQGVEHLSYAPFGELLPTAAAIVHHGGIGTAARAIEAGIPQLMIPHAYDQFDNSRRFGVLGLSSELPREELSAEKLAAALDRLLGSSIIADRCKRHADMVRSAEGLERTCDLIEALEAEDLPGRESASSSA